MRRAPILAATLAVLALAPWAGSAAALPAPAAKTVYGVGRIVPIPASIPHSPGDMVDRRIVPNLRWLAKRFPIYVTDGYSGPLPGGGWAGCHGCHVRNSDHHNGLAVDLVPVGGGTRCDRSWLPITRLARWAEPRQNRPRPPFRWVGYDGDSGHGCGHHLHLSWEHSLVAEYRLAQWVQLLPTGSAVPSRRPAPKPKPARRKPPAGPPGGLATVRAGGISARGD